jgi:hypothetical protein
MKRLVKGDESLLKAYIFNPYPMWTSFDCGSVGEAILYINKLQSLVDSINNPKLYDSIGQELSEGDDVEYIVKEAFSQGILKGKLEMFNGKLTIDKFITLPEEIDNTKLYIRKVVK